MNIWLLSIFGLVVLWWCAESLSYQDSNVLEIKIFGIGFAYDLSCRSEEVITKFHMKLFGWCLMLWNIRYDLDHKDSDRYYWKDLLRKLTWDWVVWLINMNLGKKVNTIEA